MEDKEPMASPPKAQAPSPTVEKPSVWFEFCKGCHDLFWQWFGLDKVAEDVNKHGEAVRKGAALRFLLVIALLAAVLGCFLRGYWDDERIEKLQSSLDSVNGEKLEAERTGDKYQTLYSQDQNTLYEVGQIKKAESASNSQPQPDQDEKISTLIAQNEQTKRMILDALNKPNPADALADNLAKTPIPPLPPTTTPDFDAANSDLQARLTQVDAQQIEEKREEDKRAHEAAAFCSTEFEHCIKTFTSYLQAFALKNGDKVDSDFQRMPDSLPSMSEVRICSISLEKQKTINFIVSETFYAGSAHLMIRSASAPSNTPTYANISMTDGGLMNGSKTYSMDISYGGKSILPLRSTDADFNANANTILTDLIETQSGQFRAQIQTANP